MPLIDAWGESPEPTTRTHDTSGRPYARLSALKPGDLVIVDDGFTCMKRWSERAVVEEADLADGVRWLGVRCRSGIHLFIGQLQADGDTLIGVYQKDEFDAH